MFSTIDDGGDSESARQKKTQLNKLVRVHIDFIVFAKLQFDFLFLIYTWWLF